MEILLFLVLSSHAPLVPGSTALPVATAAIAATNNARVTAYAVTAPRYEQKQAK